jgi:hypothetical protein
MKATAMVASRCYDRQQPATEEKMSEPNYGLVKYRTAALLKKAEEESLTEFEFEDANSENWELYVAGLEKKGWKVEHTEGSSILRCTRKK